MPRKYRSYRTRRSKCDVHERSGTTVVEFAFIAPVFILMLFGLLEFGRAVMLKQIVTDVASEGCRTAVVSKGKTTQDVHDAITATLQGRSVPEPAIHAIHIEEQPLGGGDFTDVSDLSDVERGQPIRVTIEIQLGATSWLPNVFFSDATIIDGQAQMKRE